MREQTASPQGQKLAARIALSDARESLQLEQDDEVELNERFERQFQTKGSQRKAGESFGASGSCVGSRGISEVVHRRA